MARLWQRFFGDRESVTVPPLDGPWTPNDLIEEGISLGRFVGLVDALVVGGRLAVLTAGSVVLVDASDGVAVAEVALDGTGTAFCSVGGDIVVAIEGKGLVRYDGGLALVGASGFHAGIPTSCITAMCVGPDGQLWLTQGSSDKPAADWKRDLLAGGSTGSVWRSSATASVRIAAQLAWPAGIHVDASRAAVSEAWRHRLIGIREDSPPTVILDDLPAYPGHITGDLEGFTLACPLPRSSLVEFVMKEKSFVADMTATLDERAWVVPQLGTLRHPLEQVQGGELLVFGQVKPWAPTRSYGLAAITDHDLKPRQSIHSRANGRRHGVARTVRHGDDLLVVSRGSGDILKVRLPRRTHVSL